MNKMITIIMPSYNVAPYIRQCLDSVVNQTYSNLEILCIDAGSDDGTGEILDEYAAKDDRIKIYISDKKSYGCQMNMGLSLANGEYIGVVETDDYIKPNMYELLLRIAEDNSAQMVKGAALYYYNNRRDERAPQVYRVFPKDDDRIDSVIAPSEMPELLIQDSFLWLGLYRRDLLEGIRFNETPGAAFQDIGFQVQVLSKCERAVYTDAIVYHYRQDNVASSSYNPKGYAYMKTEYEYAYPFIASRGEGWIKYYYYKMLKQSYNRINQMVKSGRFWDEALPDIGIIVKKLTEGVRMGYLDSSFVDEQMLEALEILSRSPKELYDLIISEKVRAYRPVINMIKFLNGRKAVIFGCGRYGKYLIELFACRFNQQLSCITDNNKSLWGTVIKGINVGRPDSVIANNPRAAFIISSAKYSEEIRRQLLENGVSSDNIYIYESGEVWGALWDVLPMDTD